MPPVRSAVLAALLPLALAACNQTNQPATIGATPAGVTPGSFQLPAGGGCSGDVAQFRAVIDNDLATGNVAQSVHGRVAREIDGAAAACSAGRSADASRMIAATKARFGYR
ncbi:hypothetical protein [Salinarimonas soli]|uniref:Lipoprotein n=1 Tax=Salinarimonas soli TaxID=1638099 RepID=A0A5B2VA13_9HYPH|nr:hypothetical protein [Salinarimonas soli]KAA2235179.1 hypothetical protein F0L46_20755 [Salinarimonas soli]